MYHLIHFNQINNAASFLKRIKFKDLELLSTVFIIQTLDQLGCSTLLFISQSNVSFY